MTNTALPGFAMNLAKDKVTFAGRFNFQDADVLEEASEHVLNSCAQVDDRGRLSIFFYVDYVCTWARKRLMRLFQQLETHAAERNLEIDVQWAFEEDDEDMLELGEIYQEGAERLRFSFKELES